MSDEFTELLSRSLGLPPNPAIHIPPDTQREFNRRSGKHPEVGVEICAKLAFVHDDGVFSFEKKTINGQLAVEYHGSDGSVEVFFFRDHAAREAIFAHVARTMAPKLARVEAHRMSPAEGQS